MPAIEEKVRIEAFRYLVNIWWTSSEQEGKSPSLIWHLLTKMSQKNHFQGYLQQDFDRFTFIKKDFPQGFKFSKTFSMNDNIIGRPTLKQSVLWLKFFDAIFFCSKNYIKSSKDCLKLGRQREVKNDPWI